MDSKYKQINLQLINKCQEYKSEIHYLRLENKKLNEEMLMQRERCAQLESVIFKIYGAAQQAIGTDNLSNDRSVLCERPVLEGRSRLWGLSVIAEESIQASISSHCHSDSESPPACHIQARFGRGEVLPPYSLTHHPDADDQGSKINLQTMSPDKENMTSEFSFTQDPTIKMAPCSTPMAKAASLDETCANDFTESKKNHILENISPDLSAVQRCESSLQSVVVNSESQDTLVNVELDSTLRGRSVSVDSAASINQKNISKTRRRRRLVSEDDSTKNEYSNSDGEDMSMPRTRWGLRTAPVAGSLAEPKLNTKMRRKD